MGSAVDADVLAELNERWKDLTSFVVEEVRDKWWNRIVAAYCEPHRRYHTLEHIHKMFQHYDCHKDSLKDRFACALAIFFHDIVYDPKIQSNEEKSSAVFREFTHDTTVDSGTYITTLIEATLGHLTEAHTDKAATGDDDIHYFLDFDMAVLGSTADEYSTYSEQIRQEYIHLDDATYAENRIKVLKQFLQIPNIFATAVFRDSYEERARDNMRHEIDALSKSSAS